MDWFQVQLFDIYMVNLISWMHCVQLEIEEIWQILQNGFIYEFHIDYTISMSTLHNFLYFVIPSINKTLTAEN